MNCEEIWHIIQPQNSQHGLHSHVALILGSNIRKVPAFELAGSQTPTWGKGSLSVCNGI